MKYFLSIIFFLINTHLFGQSNLSHVGYNFSYTINIYPNEKKSAMSSMNIRTESNPDSLHLSKLNFLASDTNNYPMPFVLFQIKSNNVDTTLTSDLDGHAKIDISPEKLTITAACGNCMSYKIDSLQTFSDTTYFFHAFLGVFEKKRNTVIVCKRKLKKNEIENITREISNGTKAPDLIKCKDCLFGLVID